ncbi:MAG TPA: hypothetical protein PKA88_00450 [Polyangiaceae bacterium]|nr:hypothetical protein [Polyangiaceae bacterium]
MQLRNLPASIFGHDNDQYMVASCEEPLPGIPSEVFCAVCGWKKEWRFTRPDFALGSRKRDVSMTYDGAMIISERARAIFMSCGEPSFSFQKLTREPEYFHLTPWHQIELELDPERQGARFGKRCDACGLHDWVAGATPPIKAMPDAGHVFFTDILFGSFNERHPRFIVSGRARQLLASSDLSGLELELLSQV